MELQAAGEALAGPVKAGEALSKRQKCNRNAEMASAADELEKCDVSPENSTKRDTPNGRMATSDIQAGSVQLPEGMPKSISLFDVCPAPPSPKHAMAFTIDFGERDERDEQRYKSMYERFQSRHRRGASLTKFDEPQPPRTRIPMSARLPRKQLPTPDKGAVKMRDKSRLQAPQDASKRHSWSPRSSTVTPDAKIPATKFTPRSLTLAKALEGRTSDASSEDALQAPLDDLRPVGEDQVSEAGTYTLDADNYTEEQKERMNIDQEEELKIEESPKPERPTCFETNLETFDYDLSQRDEGKLKIQDGQARRRNVLEISCSHETSTAKPKVSYLERLKNRVRNISDRTFHKSRSPDKLLPSPDVGCFTSVTTSGILSVKPTLDTNPRLTRRNSLTKSQIDNSEYVQGVSRLNLGGSEECGVRSPRREVSSGSAIKTAATKSDWIQEWARHARQHSAHMSRSYNFESSPTDERQRFKQEDMSRSQCDGRRASVRKPPVSPTKIPSPIGTLRPRSRNGSQTELANDTDVYLQKTAAAITTLQKMHRESLNNSPQSPRSPQSEEMLLMQLQRMHRLHRRNHSLDGTEAPVRRHTRHHSFEGTDNLPPRPVEALVAKRRAELIKQPTHSSPIRRSTSFSAKTSGSTPKMPSKVPTKHQQSIQKSASSTNFRAVIAYADDDIMEFYINDNVDLDGDQLSSESDLSDAQQPISNTRCNKAFLMRMEQNRRPASAAAAKQGVMACPNTPEMRRREPNVRTSFRERMSMPRDSSLNRMKQDLARRQQPQPPPAKAEPKLAKVQPKYMDISKYKPVTGANFLKKDESKSYLLPREVKKSPSSASVNLSRTDAQRASNRSIKSAGMRPSSGKKEPPIAQKQAKEAELAMWKRRASYDPMKAALEGKRKQDEARRLAQQQQSKLGESSSAVLRSQSFHSGVSSQLRGQASKTTIDQWNALTLSDSSDENES
ncbi:uncharacterized protein LOC132255522 [Phlebotomus argentipes]|uniref:uncharacterized protein LOC132255522 n=1 Tax=Phlebotomus argentipes TaxID=94469 RepID=UPI00289298EB|nr:uncharacterized protein LOC132255522 [Phlebotomus argentipes]